jgi:hypothetical protein
MPWGGPFSHKGNSEMTLPDMVEFMKEYSVREYSVDPYIVGVCLDARDATSLLARGADAVTGYAFLPNFRSSGAEPIQNYSDLVAERMQDWRDITKAIGRPYVPPVVVGWDASPRGVNGVRLDEVAGTYPFTPIVEGSSSKAFSDMLRKQTKFILEHVPPEEQYIPITAWNEVTEGTALLPKVNSDGTLDNSYLEAVYAFTQQRKHETKLAGMLSS